MTWRTVWRRETAEALRESLERPEMDLPEARRQLELAEKSGDPVRIFIARGDVQRLTRTPPKG